jgi:hypothetical protein
MDLTPVLQAVHGLIRRIPFYPLSALSMLLGCYTLNNALGLQPGQTGKLLILLLTLNAYEALLIGLGLFLVRRRGLADDGRTLLLIEAFFIADVTLLSGECFASSFTTGLLVSAAAFFLAVLKAGVVVRTLAPGAEGHAAVLLVPMAAIFATPGAFALLARVGLMGPVTAYLAYWLAAGTIVLLALDSRLGSGAAIFARSAVAGAFRRVLAWVLPVSLVLHVGGAAWVHHVLFYWADLGPILFALGVARLLADVSWPVPAWSYRFPLLAILFSLGAPDVLSAVGPLGLTFTPLRAVLGAMGVAYLATYPVHRSVLLAAGASAGLILGLAGHSASAIVSNMGWVFSSLGQGGTSLVPRTATGWGILAVVLAFVLLGLGAAASLWRPKADHPPGESDPTKGE